MTTSPLGLTLKHVDAKGDVFYIAAHYIQLIWPTDGRGNYALFNAGDRLDTEGGTAREITGGTVYIMNPTGKTIDVWHLGQVAPVADPEPKAA